MKIQQSKSFRLFIAITSSNDGGIYEYSILQNQWLRIGINTLDEGDYYCDLNINSNSDKLYYGGKGIYVRSLKE